MLYFIVNPSSSSGEGIRVWEKVEKILKERNAEYECILLDSPGEAARIAALFSESLTPCTLVVVGGDGTVDEFLQGITNFDGITFACIPTGSGNDFARGLRLPSNPKDAVDMILEEKTIRNINIGTVTSGDTEHAFAVSSGIGFDAAVCYESNKNGAKQLLNKIHAGKMVYTIDALRLIFSMKFMQVRLLVDDSQLHTFEKTYFVAAMNTKYEGGGFMFAPKASPVDDELDIIVVEGIPRWKLPFLLPTAFFGKHVNLKGIHIFRCQRAVVQCDAENCVHADGEHVGFYKKVTFALKKERLRTIVD